MKDEEVQDIDSLAEGQVLRGYVSNSSNVGIFVRYERTHTQFADSLS